MFIFFICIKIRNSSVLHIMCSIILNKFLEHFSASRVYPMFAQIFKNFKFAHFLIYRVSRVILHLMSVLKILFLLRFLKLLLNLDIVTYSCVMDLLERNLAWFLMQELVYSRESFVGEFIYLFIYFYSFVSWAIKIFVQVEKLDLPESELLRFHKSLLILIFVGTVAIHIVL